MEDNYKIETILNIFTVVNGELNILLIKRQDEPYKGYWELPSMIMHHDELLMDSVCLAMEKRAYLPSDAFISCNQGYVFDALDRKVDERVIGVTYNCIIDSRVADERKLPMGLDEVEWFAVSSLPKLAYDHQSIVYKALNSLKMKILYEDGLRELFPSDFTLPELQRVYEIITGNKCDRRNFRKKLLDQDLLEDTGYKTEGSQGRPAKLYRFKDDIEFLEVI